MNTKPLIKLACRKVFGDASGLVDMLAAHCPTTRGGRGDEGESRVLRPASHGR